MKVQKHGHAVTKIDCLDLKLKKAPAYEHVQQGRAGHNEYDTLYNHNLQPLGYSSPKSVFTALGNFPCIWYAVLNFYAGDVHFHVSL